MLAQTLKRKEEKRREVEGGERIDLELLQVLAFPRESNDRNVIRLADYNLLKLYVLFFSFHTHPESLLLS